MTRTRRLYVPHPDRAIAAVRLKFGERDFQFTYEKWGATQRAKAGDWLVDNDGDVYTVDAAVFARTYRAADGKGPGAYVKTTPVWAERTSTAGVIATKEGATHYEAGDYLVWNSDDDADRYAIPAGQFEKLYVPAEEDQR